MAHTGSKNDKISIFGRTRNFLWRAADGYVLKSSSLSNRPFSEKMEEIENLGMENPDVTKALIDRALREETSKTKIKVDVTSQEFKDEINKRIFVKNVKQKLCFALGSVPMFKTLQDISIVTAINAKGQIPINLGVYCGISMPAFVALHMLEHTLPISPTRTIVKATKVIIGLPFCVTSELVDKVSGQALKLLNMPDTTVNMQGTIGVPIDIRLEDVLKDMKKWGDYNDKEIEALNQVWQLHRSEFTKKNN